MIAIIASIRPNLVQMSKHKYASNVIEKCVHYTTTQDRTSILNEICTIREDGIITLSLMMKDPFANYVIQRLLDTCVGEERTLLLEKIRPHLGALRKFTYGKHLINSKLNKRKGDLIIILLPFNYIIIHNIMTHDLSVSIL